MAASVLRKPAFFGGPRSHCMLALDTLGTIVVGQTVTIGGTYTALVEQLFPNVKIRVQMLPPTSPGSFGVIHKKGATVA